MSEFLISVIVPCYNVEAYIGRCVKSIVNQTIGFEKIQLIMINDYSVDNTYQKLLEIENRYPDNVLVINMEENKGQSVARNAGIDYAEGEFISFVDSDDWIETNTYEKCIDIFEEYNVDYVCFKYDRVGDDGSLFESNDIENCFYDTGIVDNKKKYIVKRREDISPCNKLYRLSLIKDNNIRFPEGLYYEDNYFSFMAMIMANGIYDLNEILYHWYFNENSTTTTIKKPLDRVIVQTKLLNDLKEIPEFGYLKEEIEFNYYSKMFAETMFAFFQGKILDVEIVDKLKAYLFKYVPNIKNNKYYLGIEEINQAVGTYHFRDLVEREVNMQLLETVFDKMCIDYGV